MRRSEGTALLEALLAVAIIGAVTVSTLAMAAQVAHSIARASVAEREWLEADRFVRAVSLWPSSALDQRIGVRRQGEWWLTVSTAGDGLYRIGLRRHENGPDFIWTVVYRQGQSGG